MGWVQANISKLGKTITTLLIVVIVALPLIGAVRQLIGLRGSDKRTKQPLQSFVQRSEDKAGEPKLFEEPLLSITFDDGWESLYVKAAPLLGKYGIHTTQYVLSGLADNQLYMSDFQIKALDKAGHDIQCHSIDHADLTTLDAEDLEIQLRECQKQLLKRFGVAARDFASPYGHTNKNTIAAIKRYYRSHRNTNGDISNGMSPDDVNLPTNFDPYNIIAFTVRSTTTVQEIDQAIDYTIKNKGWLILTYHQIDDESSQFGLTSNVLEEQLATLSKAKLKIATVKDVLDNANLTSFQGQ